MQTVLRSIGNRKTLRLPVFFVATLAALLIAGCAGSSKSESTGEYVDDTVITTKVKASIVDALGVGASAGINVETFKGIVQLSGFSDSEADRTRAAAEAASVRGVRRVENKISIK